MGLIKKKAAIRTTEAGVKYICDVCSSDITATVSESAAPHAKTFERSACGSHLSICTYH